MKRTDTAAPPTPIEPVRNDPFDAGSNESVRSYTGSCDLDMGDARLEHSSSIDTDLLLHPEVDDSHKIPDGDTVRAATAPAPPGLQAGSDTSHRAKQRLTRLELQRFGRRKELLRVLLSGMQPGSPVTHCNLAVTTLTLFFIPTLTSFPSTPLTALAMLGSHHEQDCDHLSPPLPLHRC